MKAFISKLLKKTPQPNYQGEVEVQVYFPSTTEGPKEQIIQHQKRQDIGEDEQEQQQILITLMKMNELLKITKITKQLKGEHLTLCHVNRLLCEQMIDVRSLRKFLLNKTSQNIFIDEDTDYFKGIDKIDKNINKNTVIQHYTTYSNGIIFQFYSVRALLWKIITKYLPASKNKWISLMEGKLIHYNELIKEYVLEIVIKKKKKKDFPVQNGQKIMQIQREAKKKVADHPLNSLKESKWKTFFEDQQLWHLIQKDTIRTKPNCKFFNQQFQIEYLQETLSKYGITKNEVHLSKQKQKTKTFYYDCLTRIIYTFLKRNLQHQYCQGMNQLAALIFYSYANKNSEYFRRIAESDAYFCFQKIMIALMKLPVPGFLNGQKYSHKFQELLKKVDLRLIQELQTKPGMLNSLTILSIKWFGSLFLNEFQIDQSLILWDGFLACLLKQEGNQTILSFHNLLMSVGLALIHLNRSKLQKGQNPMLVFAKITHHPQAILQKALNLYKIFKQFFQ